MRAHEVTRRQFVLGSAATLLAARALGQSASLTAQQVVDRIQNNVGVPWKTNSADGIKAGDPSTAVTGILTVAMPTLPLLRRAAAAHQNFIVTQEPLFYLANDAPSPTDAVYLAKKRLIDDEKLVIFRFSDHWSARQPNVAVSQMAKMFLNRSDDRPDGIYDIPETTLGALLKPGAIRGARIVGDPAMRVRRVFISPGTTTQPAVMAALKQADAVIAGEPREWEAVPYVLDTAAAGQPKGMIVVGRIVSENPGMAACSEWIRNFVPEVPVQTLATDEPYWNAQS